MLFQKMRSVLFLSLIGFSLSACDTFKSGTSEAAFSDPNVDTTSPIVGHTYPVAESIGVEVDSVIRITFTELMDVRTLGGGTHEGKVFPVGVQLYSGVGGSQDDFSVKDKRAQEIEYSVIPGVGEDLVTGDPIDIEVSRIILRPQSGRFALNSEYTVLVSEDVTDLADDPETEDENEANSLDNVSKVGFITEEGEWKEAASIPFVKQGESVEDDPVTVEASQFEPSLASNAIGDVLVVWLQGNSAGSNESVGVWASRYLPNEEKWWMSDASASGNTNVQRIDNTELTTNALGAKITLNNKGKAAAVWYQAPESSDVESIWLSMFDGSVWKVAEMISDNQVGGGASSPEIGIDENGNIFAVWLEFDGGVQRIKANYYDASASLWLPNALTLNAGLSGDAKQPSLSVTKDGLAMVVWAQEISDDFHIYGSRYLNNISPGWGAPKKIDSITLGSGSASKPKIAIDNNNDAFAIWQHYDGQRENIWFNRFSGGVWGNASQMETDNRSAAVEPYIVIGSENQAFATWVQTGGSEDSLNVKSFTLENGWDMVADQIRIASEIHKPSISFDREGNAIAVWVEGFPLGHISANRYSKLSSNWGGAYSLEDTNNKGGAVTLAPLLEDGRVLSVWSHFNGENFSLVSALFSD